MFGFAGVYPFEAGSDICGLRGGIMYSARQTFAILCLVISFSCVVRSACVGTTDAEIPYTLSHTKSGDSTATSFYVLVCGMGCQADSYCPDLTSISVGATGVTGADGNDECGATFPIDLSASSGGCKTVTFAVQEPDASLDKVCPSGCQVKFALSDGQSVVKSIDGKILPASSPEVVTTPSPEVVTTPSPEVVTTPSPSGPVSPSNTPEPYGRRRISQTEARRLMQYGGNRRLSQYGEARKLRQYGSK